MVGYTISQILSDPLDIEERDLNNQLMMSLTLTLVDEENIRQRLLEIRKQKLRKNFHVKQQGLKERFEKITETVLFENQTNILAKEDEEKALVLRYLQIIAKYIKEFILTAIFEANFLHKVFKTIFISDCHQKPLPRLNRRIFMSDYRKYLGIEK